MKNGFCVVTEDESVWLQTHAICFYEDTCWAIVMYLIFSVFKSGIEDHPDGEYLNESIRGSIASIFMHGAAHLYIGLNLDEFYARSSYVPLAQSGGENFARNAAITYMFWFFMLKPITIFTGSLTENVIKTLIIATTHLFFIPLVFGLTYVNCVIFCIKAVKGLVSQKDQFYNIIPFFMTLPLALMVWIEAVACDSFLKQYGGHAWFDFAIPASTLAMYFYGRNKLLSESKKKVE